MSRLFSVQDGILILRGDTFQFKDQIKANGGRWDASKKCWILKDLPQNTEFVLSLGFQLQTSGESPSSESLVAKVESTSLEKIWNVSEFINFIQSVLAEKLSRGLWIAGEITSFKSSNGHFYFDLSEPEESATSGGLKTSSLSCVLWAGKSRILTAKYGDLPLAEGLKVKLFVFCELRREGSRITGVVEDLDLAFTTGDLALRRQLIVRDLRKRGLYDRNKQAILSPMPLSIALVTASQSRAASDFVDELSLSGFAFRITLYDVNMQGEQTSKNVCSAFKEIAKQEPGRFDIVVVTRGGGSRLDLRWFDDLEIAKAIAYCSIPVMTAIGHFEDVSIADEVSFKSEKTPTGAARFLGIKAQETLHNVFLRIEDLGRRLNRRVAHERGQIERIEDSLVQFARRRVLAEKRKLESYESSLKLLKNSLTKTLARGFALIRDADGNILDATAVMEMISSTIQLEMVEPGGKWIAILQARVEKGEKRLLDESNEQVKTL